jgi:Asp-tRNA(Asn)/Glu-tRNA(Gln) amidotransferase A subunit family amidase
MLSALALARAIEAGHCTPADALAQSQAAIAAQEPTIRAFAHLKDAPVVGAATSRLRGLPVALKDNIDTCDMPTTCGSPAYAGYVPRVDAAVAVMARRAGATLIGKTVSTEFAYFTPGPTRNPANPAHTPGGSSSGSAAAVAAGMVPVALGSQTAGSIIRPASYCGVTGFKPSFKLVPSLGLKPFAWSLDTVGFFAKSVADVAFAASAITERDLRVDAGLPSAPRLTIIRTHLWSQASPAMQTALEHAAKAAEAAGARIVDVVLPPLFEDVWRAQFTVMGYEAARALGHEFDHHRDLLSPKLAGLLDDGLRIAAETYDEARRTANRARKAMTDILADSDAILTPSAPGAAPAGIEATGDPMFNRLWTLLGMPCINVTGLRDLSGLPLGVQIVGRFGRDRAALEAAHFLETALTCIDPEISA